jgi:thioredoxin-like negative regulator of GroEL
VPAQRLNLVMIWSTWSAHSPEALTWLQQARDAFSRQSADLGVMTAIEPATRQDDASAMLKRYDIALPEIPLDPQRFTRTEAKNQIPTTLLFRDGVLLDSRLGAQTSSELQDWVQAAR